MTDADNPQSLTFRDTLLAACPRWLRNGDIGKVMYAIGVHLDVLADATTFGIRKRYPEATSEDAAAIIGANRFIVRGRNEPWETYSIRLSRWLIDHRVRGNPYPLLQQLNAYWQGAFPISLIYYGTNVRLFNMNTAGAITRTLGDNVDPNRGWSNWLLIYYWPDPLPPPEQWGTPGAKWGDGRVWGSGLTPTEVADLRRVPKQWGNAHTRGRIRLQYQGDPLNTIEIGLE